MKHTKLALYALMSSVLLFTACGDDDDDVLLPAPVGPSSFTVTPETAVVIPGTSVFFEISGSSDDALTAVYISTGLEALDTIMLSSNSVDTSYFWMHPDTASLGDVFTVNFTLEDVNGLANAKFASSAVTVVGTPMDDISPAGGDTIFNFVGIAQGSFDLVNDTRLSSTSANAPFTDMRNASNSAGFVSDWTSLTATSFFAVDETEDFTYESATREQVAGMFETMMANGETPLQTVPGAVAGDVFIAKLRADDNGDINYITLKIDDVNTDFVPNGGAASGAGALVFSYRR